VPRRVNPATSCSNAAFCRVDRTRSGVRTCFAKIPDPFNMPPSSYQPCAFQNANAFCAVPYFCRM
jgi:hypothetical protein